MKAQTMKAVVYRRYGAPEVLHLEEVAKPEPKANEVRIRIHATSVTSGDWRVRKAQPFLVRMINGLFKPKNKILGNEFSGVVEATGSQVSKFKTGDPVFGLGLFGAYAEYICKAETDILALKPQQLSHEEAATLTNGAFTALYFLRKANPQPGQKILIYGASGSNGTYAIQLAKVMGMEVTAVCSTRNIEMVKSLGADHVIDYTRKDFSLQRERYDIIFDTVGKTTFHRSYRVLKPGGYFLSAAISFPLIFQAILTSMGRGRKVIIGNTKQTPEDLEYIRALAEAGKLRPAIDRTYGIEEIVEAHRYVEKGHKRGNVPVRMALSF